MALPYSMGYTFTSYNSLGVGQKEGAAERYSKLIKGYAGIEELLAALLNTLIEKITIGEPQDVDGEHIQEVKIYYIFIGCISQEEHIC